MRERKAEPMDVSPLGSSLVVKDGKIQWMLG